MSTASQGYGPTKMPSADAGPNSESGQMSARPTSVPSNGARSARKPRSRQPSAGEIHSARFTRDGGNRPNWSRWTSGDRPRATVGTMSALAITRRIPMQLMPSTVTTQQTTPRPELEDLMDDDSEVRTVSISGATWRVEVGAAADPGAVDPALAEGRVIIREWKPGGAEVSINPGSGGHTIQEVVDLARQELLSARDLLEE